MTCLNTGGPWFFPDGSGSGTCQESNEHCVAPLSMCPEFPEPDIMVKKYKKILINVYFIQMFKSIQIAIHGDPTCRLFRPCRLPGAAGTPCTPPLVFNRNSGTCDFEQNAPCEVHGEGGGGGGPLPTCEPGATGTFPGRTCYEFIFCFDGIMSGPFHCGPGLIFDQSAGGCVIDTAGACPRTRLLTIPRAKVITDSIERKIPERFNRF